jgi:hypothetical protein
LQKEKNLTIIILSLKNKEQLFNERMVDHKKNRKKKRKLLKKLLLLLITKKYGY